MAQFKRVGALWNKKGKEGKKDFMSGTIDLGAAGDVNVMVFASDKQEENHPDFTIHAVADDKEKPK